MHSKSIIHGYLDLRNIEFYKDEIKWKLVDLEYAERFGEDFRIPPFSKNIAPEALRAAEDRKVVAVSPELDMWSYGMIALSLLAGGLHFASDVAHLSLHLNSLRASEI